MSNSDFDSAYYFDGGTFRYPVAGETHVNGTGQPGGGMDVKVSVGAQSLIVGSCINPCSDAGYVVWFAVVRVPLS